MNTRATGESMLPEDFKKRAQRLGHSVEALERGAFIRSSISIVNIDELKNFLQVGTTRESRDQLVKDLFAGIPPAGPAEHDVSYVGILRRAKEYLFGNTPLSSHDRERTASLFPMTIDTVSGSPPNPITGEWNLGTSANLQIYNVNTLDLEQGGYITVHNTPIIFTVQSLTRNGSAPSPFADFNIFGVTGAAGSAGTGGGTGGDGTKGSGGNCTGGGGIAGDNGGAGNTGTDGATGGVGAQGLTGLPSLTAQITLNGIIGAASALSVFTRSGTGGAGGPGGAGGTGGQGGPGGDGASCACEGTNGGPGAPGGRGGAGGTGGTGGAGADATANILVAVPKDWVSRIVGITALAPPGRFGTGGAAGAGGTGGSGGAAGKHENWGSQGATGGGGAPGQNGASGAQSGAPAQIKVQAV
jgi:hypothetical protein